MFRKKHFVNVSRHPLNSCVPAPELYGLDRNAEAAGQKMDSPGVNSAKLTRAAYHNPEDMV